MKYFLILLLGCCVSFAYSQHDTNLLKEGSFENNTATSHILNLSNTQYNAIVNFSTSFGLGSVQSNYAGIELLKTGDTLYPAYPSWTVNAYDGDWCIAPSEKGYYYININGDTLPDWSQQDAFSLTLDDTLTTGSWYTLSFYAMYKHPPGGYPSYLPGRLSVGMSHYANSFGVLIDTTAYTDSVWTQHSVHFQASSNFAHITCRPVREQIGANWPFVDHFVLTFDSAGVYTPPLPLAINKVAQQPKQLLKIVDILGKTASPKQKGILFYIYSDATVEKRIILE